MGLGIVFLGFAATVWLVWHNEKTMKKGNWDEDRDLY